MRHTKRALLALPVLLSTSCGPPLPADEGQESSLEQSCSLYCEQAIMCIDVSSQHVDQWEASTLTDCELGCVQMSEGGAEINSRPECVERYANLWTCASMLETCEDFEWFEYSAFGMVSPSEMWCGYELSQVSGTCT